MSFDGLVMAAVKKELTESIVGGRIEKIYQPLASEIILVIHKSAQKYRLLASAHARDARVHLTRTVKQNPLTPPLFCMVMRKHLEGGKITEIVQTGLERVLDIRVEASDELGMMSEKRLLCEIMGKHSNIILVDPAQNMILDGINRYSYATSRHREVLPGRTYIPPPETGKLDPLATGEDCFRSALWDPELDLPVDRLLLHKFAGFGPQTCREITIRAGLDPDSSSQSLGELELQRLWESFEAVKENALSGNFEPTLCYKAARPITFAAVRLTPVPGQKSKTGTMSGVLDEFFTVTEKQERLKKAAAELTRVVKTELRKCQKKKGIHEDTLRMAENAEQLKIAGELITANIYQISKGAHSAELLNYYDPENRTITVRLDPQLTPAGNAQLYFKRYNKARNSITVAERYLAEAQAEIAYLESVLVSLKHAEQDIDLAEIKAELVKEGYIAPERPVRGARKPEPVTQPSPMVLVGEDGYEILVGRNNRQNDYLTMKMAKPEDMWLHVKDVPGSHVIIRRQRSGDMPPAVLQQAGEIAAFYSQARESSKVTVDYTLRKHVRKPKGAKPGMVIYENYKSISVEPKAPSRLKETGPY